MSSWWQWLSENGVILGWLGGLSLIMFVSSLILIPILVARIPADYFVDPQRHVSRSHKRRPLLHVILTTLKNALGVSLILAGLAMLLLPGQGVLTILIGVGLTDFPGKYALERKLVAKRGVFEAINWLRKRADRQPLIRPEFES